MAFPERAKGMRLGRTWQRQRQKKRRARNVVWSLSMQKAISGRVDSLAAPEALTIQQLRCVALASSPEVSIHGRPNRGSIGFAARRFESRLSAPGGGR